MLPLHLSCHLWQRCRPHSFKFHFMRTISFNYYNKIIIHIINCLEKHSLIFMALFFYSGRFFVHVSITSPVSLTSSTKLPLLYLSLLTRLDQFLLRYVSSSCKSSSSSLTISIPTMRYGITF